MMAMLYIVAIAVHVVVAVLGIGLVGAVPLMARSARSEARRTGTTAGGERVLGSLLRATQIAFVAMAVTGIVLDVSVAGAFHRTAWFRVSIVVLAVIGFAHARARAALRKGFAPGGARDVALSRVERWGWTMCAAVALITVLMQTKPLP
jgi:hypothetical protein